MLQVTEPIAIAPDILQGDKEIYIGYLLPTLLSIEQHPNEALKQSQYTRTLIKNLIKWFRQRFGLSIFRETLYFQFVFHKFLIFQIF